MGAAWRRWAHRLVDPPEVYRLDDPFVQPGLTLDAARAGMDERARRVRRWMLGMAALAFVVVVLGFGVRY
jgi:hypothetical protein